MKKFFERSYFSIISIITHFCVGVHFKPDNKIFKDIFSGLSLADYINTKIFE